MAWSISNAMMKAYENSLCSPAQEVESSVGICSNGEQFAQSNTTPMPDQFYWPDKTTEHSRLSRFGMTCVPLTESRGGELLTWFLAGFRVRTSVPQERALDLTESAAGYGEKCGVSLAKYDQDSSTWKTAQYSLLGGLEEFSETWPRWGTMQNGVSYLLPTQARPIFESESGLWPTPCASDNSDRKVSKTVHITANGLPKHVAPNGVKSQMRLSQAVKMWPTPTGGGKSKTYCLGDWGGSGARKTMRELVTEEELFGPLNPEWVEWLMGWPIGLTDLKPLATARYQEWLQQHSIF